MQNVWIHSQQHSQVLFYSYLYVKNWKNATFVKTSCDLICQDSCIIFKSEAIAPFKHSQKLQPQNTHRTALLISSDTFRIECFGSVLYCVFNTLSITEVFLYRFLKVFPSEILPSSSTNTLHFCAVFCLPQCVCMCVYLSFPEITFNCKNI